MARSQTTSNLTELMNVGTSVAAYFERVGITRIEQLAGQDPLEIYDTMCRVDARRHDPCLLDTIMSAVDQANGKPARPWWTYTPDRKHLMDSDQRRR
ncbi:helix-hairpin-helix domain-containing protein [Kribbella sp. NPDC049174]|uniref:helix-hairpin-helix domain-containing protein n=1 Tax=Kribbella sp. NPDC049174 TaxID=3364112 RepID=UPI00371BB52E